MITSEFEKAQMLRNNGHFVEAVALYTNVRKVSLAENDLKTASECLHMIGVTFYQSEDFGVAEKKLQEAKDEFHKQGNDEFVGFVLRDLGLTALKIKDYTKAEALLKESIEVLHRIGNTGHEGISTVKLGNVYAQMGNLHAAVAEILKGIDLLVSSEDQFFLSSAYFDLAQVYALKKQKKETLLNIEKSLQILNTFSTEDEYQERRKAIKKLQDETRK